MRLPFAVSAPTKFETQKVKTSFPATVTTERYDPCLFHRQFQSELSQTLFQLAIEKPSILFSPEAAHEVVCVTMQECFPSTTTPEHSLEPQIEHVVQVHICQYRRDDSTLRCSSLRS